MNLLISIVLSILITFCNQVFAETYLPNIIVDGATESTVDVGLSVQVKATNQSDEVCYSGSYHKYPHVFLLRTWTSSEYGGQYIVDLSTYNRLVLKARDSISYGNIELPEGMSVQEYVMLCDFKVDQITVNIGESALILRSSLHYNVRSMYTIPYGKTTTRDYSFQVFQNVIRLTVNTN